MCFETNGKKSGDGKDNLFTKSFFELPKNPSLNRVINSQIIQLLVAASTRFDFLQLIFLLDFLENKKNKFPATQYPCIFQAKAKFKTKKNVSFLSSILSSNIKFDRYRCRWIFHTPNSMCIKNIVKFFLIAKIIFNIV
jgi:hypothetical protein